MKVGFVGLGIMGRPMAHNLMKGGHELYVYGKRTVPPEIRDGATGLPGCRPAPASVAPPRCRASPQPGAGRATTASLPLSA